MSQKKILVIDDEELITKSLLKLLNTEYGKGTRFFMQLPIAREGAG